MLKRAVLMATYNGEKFIKKQLDSICPQTLVPDFVLLRNDYPTDKNDKELSKYPCHKNYQGGFLQEMTLAIKNTLVRDVMKYWEPEYKPNHDMVFRGIASLLENGYNLNKVSASQKRHNNSASSHPSISIRDYQNYNVKNLFEKNETYHYIVYHVLKDRNYPLFKEQEDYLRWIRRRVSMVKSNKFFSTLHQIISGRKYYANEKGIIRDLIFEFKKYR